MPAVGIGTLGSDKYNAKEIADAEINNFKHS